MHSFFLGIDVSKGYADFVILDASRRVEEPAFQLDDTFEGHAQLYKILSRFCERHPEATVFAAAESTGSYENNWLHALRRFQASLPLRVARLNPTVVVEHSKASGARISTDATSAEHIASYLAAYPEKVDYALDDSLAGLRAHWGYIELLIKEQTAHFSQFEKLLYRAHPQLVTYIANHLPAWVLLLVKRYPTARRLARARASTVSQIPYVTTERAEELIARAKRSVASAEDAATEHLMQEMAEQLLHRRKRIQAQKKAMTEQLELPHEIDILTSFGSISEYSAVGLLLEIQSVERFASAKKIASFFGVHPTFKTSGDGVTGMRMSKQGSSRMRGLLFMIALNAIQHNPVIAPLYKRLLEKGMARMAAIGVCMHKTLRIVYGMLKNQTPFDPDVDRRNRDQNRERRSGTAIERKRRFQGMEDEAPLSARAKKRRRQLKNSQSIVHAECGMSTLAAASTHDQRRDVHESLQTERQLNT